MTLRMVSVRNLLKLKGQIDLKNVSFKYNDNELEVLHDINLTINKGETVALLV